MFLCVLVCLQKAPEPPDKQSGKQPFGEGGGQYTLRINLNDLAFVARLFNLQLVILSQSMVDVKSRDHPLFTYFWKWAWAPVILARLFH